MRWAMQRRSRRFDGQGGSRIMILAVVATTATCIIASTSSSWRRSPIESSLMMTPTGRTMGTISQSMKPLTPKLYTPASYTASSLQQRRRYAILTNAKILTMELPDSRVKKLVKIGTGMLPVVWTLYGTPLATALGASALYAALQIQDHNPVIENQVLPKAPAPTEKENEKKSNPQAFVINIEDLESPFSSPGDSPAAPPAPAAAPKAK
mmetsp:Transcript_30725/g.52015  ORF Transcript_30725/g.52015 Transcript_30725/m.52015 type:complete len:209 (-) Transcript_30725:4990-5616(-)